jgi:hypothetical protein
MKSDFVEFTDLENIKKALENAEIDYEEVAAVDKKDSTVVETDSVIFRFSSSGDLFSVEPA